MGVVILMSGATGGESDRLQRRSDGRRGLRPGQQSDVPLFSRLLSLLVLAIFVAIGGHRMVMGGLLDTFQTIPPGRLFAPDSLFTAMVDLVTQSFALGIRAAAPLVTVLLLANLVLGLIGRTLPQLNILVIGFGLNTMLASGALILSLGAAAWLFGDQIGAAVDTVLRGLGSG